MSPNQLPCQLDPLLLQLGLPPAFAQDWLEVARCCRNIILNLNILDSFPPIYIYATPERAAHDQLTLPHTNVYTKRVSKVRGWSIFDELHHFMDYRWGKTDRIIVHANQMGGEPPLAQLIFHEVAHHIFWTRWKVNMRNQVEREVDKMGHMLFCTYYERRLPHQFDSGAFVRAIELLLKEKKP